MRSRAKWWLETKMESHLHRYHSWNCTSTGYWWTSFCIFSWVWCQLYSYFSRASLTSFHVWTWLLANELCPWNLGSSLLSWIFNINMSSSRLNQLLLLTSCFDPPSFYHVPNSLSLWPSAPILIRFKNVYQNIFQRKREALGFCFFRFLI